MLRPKDLCQGSGTKTFLDAMHSGKAHLARFVLDALDGRIINSKTENSRTPLMYAVCLPDAAARVKFTQLLLEKGADVNCQDEHGRTALSFSCELGYLDVVKLLIQHNADPEITDAWGNSPVMYAACAGHSQVLEFLIRAFKRLGLRLDRINQAGHSAIQVAGFFGHKQCVQTLNGPGRKCLGIEDQGRDCAGGLRQPNRLPKQVLERFSKQLQGKCDDHLPAVFQRHLKTGEGKHHSPDRKGYNQAVTSQLQRFFSRDGQDASFLSKQIPNSKLKEVTGAKTGDQDPEWCKEDRSRGREITQEALPMWGKAKSFNVELRPCRKQSYQGDLVDRKHTAVSLKRGSLPDEKPLFQNIQCKENGSLTNDVNKSLKVPHIPVNGAGSSPSDDKFNSAVLGRKEFQKHASLHGRQEKLLSQRGEIAPDKIPVRPPGFTGLGTRLLRRFTAPEFMKLVLDFPSGSEQGRGKMSRSETFPFSHAHEKVNGQPSADSISAVNCEFDSTVSLRSKV